MTLLRDLATLDDSQVEALLGKLGPDGSSALLLGLQTEIRERCARDGMYFLRFVKTRDEADPDAPEKPFPLYEPYIEPIWRALEQHQRVIVAKSRQMLMSWILCAFCCWWARFKPNQAVYWQTQRDSDAHSMIAMPIQGVAGYMGRCQFIEAHLPSFLWVPFRATEGRLSYSHGSIIQALPGGADQIRSKVPSLLVEDEFAFQLEQSGVWTAVVPLIQKKSKVILCSTPNGSQNQFALLWHGQAYGQQE